MGFIQSRRILLALFAKAQNLILDFVKQEGKIRERAREFKLYAIVGGTDSETLIQMQLTEWIRQKGKYPIMVNWQTSYGTSRRVSNF